MCELFQDGLKLHPREPHLFFYVTTATKSSLTCVSIARDEANMDLIVILCFFPFLTLVNTLNTYTSDDLFVTHRSLFENHDIGFLQC